MQAEEQPKAKNLISDLEQKARVAGVTIKDATAEAGVTESTFYRWKKEPPLTFTLYDKISEAIDTLASKKK